MPCAEGRTGIELCLSIADGLRSIGYQLADVSRGRRATWRISPQPLVLPAREVAWLHELGPHLHLFNVASSELYIASVRGDKPRWIADYLEQGKPERLLSIGRARGPRPAWPTVIRPDILPTSDGMAITELDSVPGGMGIVGRLSELYREEGWSPVGDSVTIPRAFDAMMRSLNDDEPRIAVVVSDESAAYRAEMRWLAESVAETGTVCHMVEPRHVSVSADGIVAAHREDRAAVPVNTIYRFFELFDLPNLPTVEGVARRWTDETCIVTPPFRPIFEEKMWFALLRHPALLDYWQRALGTTLSVLDRCIPRTWILDPRAPLPGDVPVRMRSDGSWADLNGLGRSQRHFVIKPSGFSEFAWGSRGVVVGHDIATGSWNTAITEGLAAFPQSPRVLQEFKTGRHFEGVFFDPETHAMMTVPCRVRLCPYYFVVGDEVTLAAVMATMCPLDKKKIHGMPDAIIVPCVAEPDSAGDASCGR